LPSSSFRTYIITVQYAGVVVIVVNVVVVVVFAIVAVIVVAVEVYAWLQHENIVHEQHAS